MNVVKLSKDVYLVKDLVGQAVFQQLLEYCKTITEEEWLIANTAESDTTNFWKGKFFSPDLRKDEKYEHLYSGPFYKINYKLSKMFESYSNFESVSSFLRSTGDNPKGMEVHSDDGHESHSDIKYGIVIYLNDDFEGGELYYPDLDIVYTPNAGDIVIHSGSVRHGTNPVTSGNRFFCTTFVHGNEDTKFLLGDNNG